MHKVVWLKFGYGGIVFCRKNKINIKSVIEKFGAP